MRPWIWVLCFVTLIANHQVSAQIPLLDQMLSVGLPLSNGANVVLSPPLLRGKSSDETKLALEKLAQRHTWERFSKNSPSAPVVVELSYVQDATGQRVGHNIYSAFVAYAPLATLKDQELMASLFGSNSQDKELLGFDPKELAVDVLEKAGVPEADRAGSKYTTLRIPLMNRVVIEGTARIEKLELDGGVIIAWQLEPRFALESSKGSSSELAGYFNRYRKVDRDELGKEVESPPVSYSGCGGYLSVMQTGLADNQLFIESRMVMHEPDEWFAGSNFLRSKFPPALQESAQNFRRKLNSQK